jgi:hypothetical protein
LTGVFISEIVNFIWLMKSKNPFRIPPPLSRLFYRAQACLNRRRIFRREASRQNQFRLAMAKHQSRLRQHSQMINWLPAGTSEPPGHPADIKKIVNVKNAVRAKLILFSLHLANRLHRPANKILRFLLLLKFPRRPS